MLPFLYGKYPLRTRGRKTTLYNNKSERIFPQLNFKFICLMTHKRCQFVNQKRKEALYTQNMEAKAFVALVSVYGKKIHGVWCHHSPQF